MPQSVQACAPLSRGRGEPGAGKLRVPKRRTAEPCGAALERRGDDEWHAAPPC